MDNMMAAAAKNLKKCNKILIGAGAGMGKDSGMPDFRGNQGFWNNYPPYRGKFNFYQCASPDFLDRKPHLFWGFYGSRLKMYRDTQPHYGFNLLQKLSQKVQDHFIITSNVDGHFQSFFKAQKINEVHGTIHSLQCFSCDFIYPNNFKPEINYETMQCLNLPKCPKCQSITRPNILMFGDWQWLSYLNDQQNQKYTSFLKNLKENDNLAIIEIGSGNAVPTIRNMCERIYYRYKQSIFIRINPEQDLSSPHKDKQRFFYLQQGALKALTLLTKESHQIS